MLSPGKLYPDDFWKASDFIVTVTAPVKLLGGLPSLNYFNTNFDRLWSINSDKLIASLYIITGTRGLASISITSFGAQ